MTEYYEPYDDRGREQAEADWDERQRWADEDEANRGMFDPDPGVPPPDTITAITEKDWLAQVRQAAEKLGYLVYHTHDSRRSDPGFPDLVLVNMEKKRLVFAELKREKGKILAEQQLWIDTLREAGQEAHIWRPSDIDRVIEVLSGDRLPA